jgi:DnaJ-class molecular chaperone
LRGANVNHYETLGLDRGCTFAQVRDAYRVLVKQHHPDRHDQSADAIARSQQLNAAYEILGDPARRRVYDLELDRSHTSAREPSRSRIERNISQDVTLPIEDFFRGTSLTVQVNDPGNPGGVETYQLVVPAMTAPGARFRLPRTTPMHDGFVQVRLKARPSFRFKARGSDLRCDLRISASRAAAGGSETMAGATGRSLRLTIPRNAKRGEIIRIAGEGMPKARGGRGDLLVRLTYRPEVRVTRSR